MRDTLSTLVRRALRAAAPTLNATARHLDLSTSALRRYRLGSRTPPAQLLVRLARLLRRQARELEQLAARLEREASV